MSNRLPVGATANPALAPPPKLLGKRRWIRQSLVWVLLFVALVFVRLDLTISGEFTVYPDHNADIRAPIDGLIAAIVVGEGAAVQRGQLIARIDTRDYRARHGEIEAEIAQTKAQRRLLTAGTRAEELVVAERQVATARTRHEHAQGLYQQAERLRIQALARARQTVKIAQSDLTFAREEEARYRKLANSGVVAKSRHSAVWRKLSNDRSRLAQAQSDVAVAEADGLGEVRREQALAKGEWDEAAARLAMLRAGSRAEERQAIDATIARHHVALELVRERLAQSRILSPIDGIVVTERLEEKIGQRVEAGDLIAEVYDFTTVKAEIFVPEKDVQAVSVGQEVNLKARAFPSRRFLGRITAIAPRAVASADGLSRRLIRVTTEIDNADLMLKPEMTGNAKIIGPKRPLYMLISRRFVQFLKVEFWSWW